MLTQGFHNKPTNSIKKKFNSSPSIKHPLSSEPDQQNDHWDPENIQHRKWREEEKLSIPILCRCIQILKCKDLLCFTCATINTCNLWRIPRNKEEEFHFGIHTRLSDHSDKTKLELVLQYKIKEILTDVFVNRKVQKKYLDLYRLIMERRPKTLLRAYSRKPILIKVENVEATNLNT